MNYDIQIHSQNTEGGKIEFDRLAKLTKSVKDVAIRSLTFRLYGFSALKPNAMIKKASAIYLDELTREGAHATALNVECVDFSKALSGQQYNAFRNIDEIVKLTPMTLIIESFRAALDEKGDKDLIDKDLVNSLMKFKTNFVSDGDVIEFSNRGSIPKITLEKSDFKKLADLEQTIPAARKIKVMGRLDEMKYSKMKLGLITEDGPVSLTTDSNKILDDLTEYMGKEITISGTAHYRYSGGISVIDVSSFSEPQRGDQLFKRLTTSRSPEQQVLFQLKAGKKQNPLADLKGKWPGDESFEELLKMLD